MEPSAVCSSLNRIQGRSHTAVRPPNSSLYAYTYDRMMQTGIDSVEANDLTRSNSHHNRLVPKSILPAVLVSTCSPVV